MTRAAASQRRESTRATASRKASARPTVERARQIARTSYETCRKAGHDHGPCAGYAALQVERAGHGRFLKPEVRAQVQRAQAQPRRGTPARRSNDINDFLNGSAGW
jgi:hypothetical protein